MKSNIHNVLQLAFAIGLFSMPAMAGAVVVTPEPTTVLTVGAGAVALIFYARKKRNRK